MHFAFAPDKHLKSKRSAHSTLLFLRKKKATTGWAVAWICRTEANGHRLRGKFSALALLAVHGAGQIGH